MTSLTLSGDLGDAVVSLRIAKTIGAERLNIVHHKSLRTNFLDRAHLIVPLMETQTYIKRVDIDGDCYGYDVTGMRRFHDVSDTLLKMQVKELVATSGEYVPYDSSPWLTVKDDGRNKGKIIIARSARYQNPAFPWGDLVRSFGPKMIFIGTEKEHKDFCDQFGKVAYRHTPTLLEVAQEIQSAELFIGNQSSPNAITQGLGKKSILEVSKDVCDCIYNRDNITYVTNKPFVVEGQRFSPLPYDFTKLTTTLWQSAGINAGVTL